MNTEQEEFWKGTFGSDYIERNNEESIVAANISFFANAFRHVTRLDSVLEFGCNIGLNLKAIRRLSQCSLTGIEINHKAVTYLQQWNDVNVIENSILDVDIKNVYDLTFTKGVLIHIAPDRLNDVYERLYKYSNKYILIAEYYNPTPVAVQYRGYDNKLFKRDFAGEVLSLFPDLSLLDYGFVYHGDTMWPQDDITWFLLSK